MKRCPECGQESRARKKGKCPHCNTELELIKGKYFKVGHTAPVEKLTRVLESAVKKTQDNIFPYRIPQHMLMRTKRIVESVWNEYFPIMDSRGITTDEAIRLIALAVDELINSIARDKVEIGLILWYVSGKETNRFQRILTKYVRSKERLIGLRAEEDNWMD